MVASFFFFKVSYIPPTTFRKMKLLAVDPIPLLTISLYDISSINCTSFITSLGLGPVIELPVYLSLPVILISLTSPPFFLCQLMSVMLRSEVYDPVNVTSLP